jgi:hypothetical protein
VEEIRKYDGVKKDCELLVAAMLKIITALIEAYL